MHLQAPQELISERVNARTGHYMPPSLLESQLAALEPLGPDEPGIDIDTSGTPADIAARVVDRLRLGEPGVSRSEGAL